MNVNLEIYPKSSYKETIENVNLFKYQHKLKILFYSILEDKVVVFIPEEIYVQLSEDDKKELDEDMIMPTDTPDTLLSKDVLIILLDGTYTLETLVEWINMYKTGIKQEEPINYIVVSEVSVH